MDLMEIKKRMDDFCVDYSIKREPDLVMLSDFLFVLGLDFTIESVDMQQEQTTEAAGGGE